MLTSDITEKMTLEAEAMRASHLASLGELAAGVAHEINNPINGIINYAQILSDRGSEGDQDHFIANQIIKEGDRIAKIVKNLLSFARDRSAEKNAVDIADVLSSSLALVETQLHKDGIDLTVDVSSGLPEIIAHDQQLQQVFLNVINNSRFALNRKYQGRHSNKKMKITVREVMIDNNDFVRLVFYDSGVGIAADMIDKAMNPFFTTKPGGQGTGLGLSISHGIVADHNGRIAIESNEGEYTRIIIELPVKKVMEVHS
jgi:signal transduction histidine kinase